MLQLQCCAAALLISHLRIQAYNSPTLVLEFKLLLAKVMLR
jgi:hypothetical protein